MVWLPQWFPKQFLIYKTICVIYLLFNTKCLVNLAPDHGFIAKPNIHPYMFESKHVTGPKYNFAKHNIYFRPWNMSTCKPLRSCMGIDNAYMFRGQFIYQVLSAQRWYTIHNSICLSGTFTFIDLEPLRRDKNVLRHDGVKISQDINLCNLIQESKIWNLISFFFFISMISFLRFLFVWNCTCLTCPPGVYVPSVICL